MTRRNLISVGEDDVVEAYFPHVFSSPGTRTIRVTEVRARYGFHGGYRQAPLVIGINVATGEQDMFDQSFVTRIVERCPTFPRRAPRNIFRRASKSPVYGRNGYMQGELTMMVSAVLSHLAIEISRPIDDDLLDKLFEKSRPGVIEGRHGFYLVHSKPFKRWVRQNVHRFLSTIKQLNAKGTARIREQNSWIEADLDAMMDPVEEQMAAINMEDLGPGTYNMI